MIKKQQYSEGYRGDDQHSLSRNIPKKGVYTSNGHSWKNGVYLGHYEGATLISATEQEKIDNSI